MTDGSLYIRPGAEARIVGPERQAQALAAAMDDERLQVAFIDSLDPDATATVMSSRMMAAVGVDHPVLVLPESVRALWDAEARVRPRVIEEYTGPLPDTSGVRRTSFGIVHPEGPRSPDTERGENK